MHRCLQYQLPSNLAAQVEFYRIIKIDTVSQAETLIFQGHLNVFWCSFMAFLCSSRWSDQKYCKTECAVALKPSFQTRPMRAFSTLFLARYRILKWGLRFRIFYKTLEIFNDFSRENHSHGGHEHGVRRGVFGGRLSFGKMSAGGASVLCKKTPIFGSQRSKLDNLTVRRSFCSLPAIQNCFKLFFCMVSTNVIHRGYIMLPRGRSKISFLAPFSWMGLTRSNSEPMSKLSWLPS